MSFQQGLSGLDGASKALDTISNNIANSGTSGFKSASTRFADVFAASLSGGGGSQIGVGVGLSSIFQEFTQGNITTTGNPLDLAINGQGFFRMSDNGTITFSRNGQLNLDKNGYIVNDTGRRLTGYAVDTTGAIVPGSFVDLRVNSANIAPGATSSSEVQLTLDSRATAPTAMSSGSLTGSLAGGLPATTTITTGVNDTLNLAIDGVAAAITLPAGSYSQAALATQLQSSITTALGSSGATATVSLSASPTNLIIESDSVGTSGSQGSGSTVTLAGGTAAATLLGGAPVAVAGADNFDPTDATSYTASTAQTVYDSLGNPHNMTMYFAKTSYPGRYQMYTSLDGGAVSAASQLQFSNTGVLTSAMPLAQSFVLTNGAVSPLTFPLDLTGTTQYGVDFGVNQLIQDGYTSGRLTGVSVSADGVVQGRYSNGKTQNLGQVVLASFNNPNSLQQMGGGQWAETSESGQPIPGSPGQGSLGAIQSGAVEESNVDLTAELVNMITQQRAYQANAQSIKTQDSVLQTLVNLR